MWKDFVDTLDAIAPRAMIIALAIGALLALGTLPAKSNDVVAREIPTTMLCMSIAQFFPKLGSYDVDVVADGKVDDRNQMQIAIERKTGIFHLYIINQDNDIACLLGLGDSLTILKDKIRIPLPPKKAKKLGPNDL